VREVVAAWLGPAALLDRLRLDLLLPLLQRRHVGLAQRELTTERATGDVVEIRIPTPELLAALENDRDAGVWRKLDRNVVAVSVREQQRVVEWEDYGFAWQRAGVLRLAVPSPAL
jgi:hypothetical protein